MTNKPASDTEYNYERLRSWYLASLRGNAINDLLGLEGKSVTPATLIRLDSQVIEKLMKDEPAELAPVAPRDSKSSDSLLVVGLVVVLLLLACALPAILFI